ncbi:carboxylate--amine ligase [Saliphagus sp. GCM10025308]
MVTDASGQGAVLLPAKFNPACYTCVRSLAERGVHTIVASEHENVPAGGSRFCDEQIQICSPDDDLVAYKDALKGIAARPDVRTILPLRPADPYVFATYRDEFERYASVIAPPTEALEVVNDRTKLFDAAREAGLPVPETRCLDEVDRWDVASVIKSRYNLLTSELTPSLASDTSAVEKDVVYVKPGDEPDKATIRSGMRHEPIVQEYIRHDDQYVFGALYDQGEAVATFQHRQIRGTSYTGGGGVYRESIRDPKLEAVGRALLDSLDWHGIACIEYAKDTTTGEYKLLEINPRFWQSLPCAVRAGADFPAYYWLQALGRGSSIDAKYERGVRSHYLYGEANYLLSLRRDEPILVDRPPVLDTAQDLLESCIRTPHFDVFRLDDPVPFSRELRRVLQNRIG